MLMIRLFLNLCKCFKIIKKNDDYEICRSYIENVRIDSVACPSCGAKGCYRKDGEYTRQLVCFVDGKVERHEVTMPCVECVSCGHSHAILASVVIPHSPFSFHFVISLLYAYVTRKYANVLELCAAYDVSVSTLYRICHRFIDDRKMMLGMMEAASEEEELTLSLLSGEFLNGVDGRPQDFFLNRGLSFLQAACKLRPTPKPGGAGG